jgi:hypothetical protein
LFFGNKDRDFWILELFDYSIFGLFDGWIIRWFDGLTFEMVFFDGWLLAPTGAASFCRAKDKADGGKMDG